MTENWYPKEGDSVKTTWGDTGVFRRARPNQRANMGVVVNRILSWYELSQLTPINFKASSALVEAPARFPLQNPDDVSSPISESNSGIVASGEVVAPARQPLSATFTPLPPANRTLSMPKIEVLRLPVDVVIVPDELVEIYNAAGDVVTTTIGYFLDRPGSTKAERDPLGVFSQTANPRVVIPNGVYGAEFVSECLAAEYDAERLTDRAARIVSEAWVMQDVVSGIDAACETVDDEVADAYRKQLARACVGFWRRAA